MAQKGVCKWRGMFGSVGRGFVIGWLAPRRACATQNDRETGRMRGRGREDRGREDTGGRRRRYGLNYDSDEK